MSAKIDRRGFLKRSTIVTGGILLQACSPKPKKSPSPQPTLNPQPTPQITPEPTRSTAAQAILTFLHTNDTHGHLAPFRLIEYPDPVGGVARRATLIRQIRQEADRVLLVDAGDVHHGLYQSSLMAETFQGEPDIAFMNELGYVVMGLGNHDLDYGWATFLQRREAAFFPILCANLVYADSGQPVLDAYTIIKEGGVRIAFTSFVDPDLWHTAEPPNVPGMLIVDPIETAQTLVPRLKEADLIVVLGHQYLRDNYALANAVRGIDIIFSGHEHVKLTEASQVGGALVAEAYKWGAYLGRLDVAVSEGKITSYSYSLIPLTRDIPSDPDIEARVGTLQAEMRQLYPDRFVQIGQAAIDISDKHVKYEEAPLGNLVCDVVRQKTGADVALIASSGMTNALFAGPLVVQDLHNALPYTQKIATLRLMGEQLQKVLDLSASASGTGNFSQVSGVRFRIIGGVATEVTINGQPLEAERAYLVATTYYQAKHFDGYKDLFAAGQGLNEVGVTIKEALIEYIAAHSPVHAEKDGRIAVE